jgi:ankyrin repeat protein
MEELEEQDKKAIVDAVKEGNLVDVQRLVQQDRRLLDAVWLSETPLIAAVQEQRREIARYLLDEGAQINLRAGVWELTALDWACMLGHARWAAAFLRRGADPKHPDHGLSALMRASQHCRTEVIKVLLAHGCDYIDDRFHSDTALHMACSWGYAAVVGLLLGAGANPDLMARSRRTPLSVAVKLGHVECVTLFQVSIMCVCVCVCSWSLWLTLC